jgi:hypothetical protein
LLLQWNSNAEMAITLMLATAKFIVPIELTAQADERGK